MTTHRIAAVVALAGALIAAGLGAPVPASAAEKLPATTIEAASAKVEQVTASKVRLSARLTVRHPSLDVLGVPAYPAAARVSVNFYPKGGGAKQSSVVTLDCSGSVCKGTWKQRYGAVGQAWFTYDDARTRVTFRTPRTSISGWVTARTTRAHRAVVDTVTVTPSFGRTVVLERLVAGRWVRQKTFRAGTGRVSNVAISYPADWGKRDATSRWRVVVPATALSTARKTAVATQRSTRVYDVPRGRYQLLPQVPEPKGGGFALTRGKTGVKTNYVADRLKIPHANDHVTVTAAFVSKVAAYQRSRGLRATGVTDKATWVAMGYSADAWTELDTYRSPVVVDRSMTRAQIIDRMIASTMRYEGDIYVWGGGSKPGAGIDCSGILLQALYAVGINPSSTDTVRHAGTRPGSTAPFLSTQALYNDSSFQHVPASKMARGDFVFWGKGAISHSGLYLGGGMVIESTPYYGVHVTTMSSAGSRYRLWPTVVRPLP